MADYLTAQDIGQYLERGMKSITVDEMPRLTDEARDLLEEIDFQIIVRPSKGLSKTSEKNALCAITPSQRKSFKALLMEDRKLVGTFIQVGHSVMAEFVGKLGFDFLVIDSEHSAMHIETIQSLLQGLKASPTYGLVRIPTIRYEHIARCLDAGADGLLIPQVRSPEDLEQIREAAFYPPEGRRGIGPGRSSDFGLNLMNMKNDPNRDLALIVQIETKEALDHIDRIISSDFIDMVFVGPGDLSMNLGVFGQFSNPIMTREVSNIIERSKFHRRKIGMFAANFEDAARWLEEGMDMVVINSELGLMGQFVQQGLGRLRSLLGNH